VWAKRGVTQDIPRVGTNCAGLIPGKMWPLEALNLAGRAGWHLDVVELPPNDLVGTGVDTDSTVYWLERQL